MSRDMTYTNIKKKYISTKKIVTTDMRYWILALSWIIPWNQSAWSSLRTVPSLHRYWPSTALSLRPIHQLSVSNDIWFSTSVPSKIGHNYLRDTSLLIIGESLYNTCAMIRNISIDEPENFFLNAGILLNREKLSL